MTTTDDAIEFERINYTVKETGQEIRRALRAAFPGVKFSLRGSRGTGYGWFSLSWTDGPTCREVDAITNGFRSSYFDGMDDSTRSIPATMYASPDGTIREHRYSCNGVNSTRTLSDTATAWAAGYVEAYGGTEVYEPGMSWATAERCAWKVLQYVDLCGIDWDEIPAPGEKGAGRHSETCYSVDTGKSPLTYLDPPKHRAEA